MLLLKKDDRLANWLIGTLSVVVFTTVVVLNRIKLEVELQQYSGDFQAAIAVVKK